MKKVAVPTILLGFLAACANDMEPRYRVGNETLEQRRVDAEQTHAELGAKMAAAALDSPPQLISSRFPDYPPSWRAADIEGKVVVRFTIEADGKVSNPSVVGSPPPELAAIVLHAIMQWKFKPAVNNGTQVSVRAQQEFSFKVE